MPTSKVAPARGSLSRSRAAGALTITAALLCATPAWGGEPSSSTPTTVPPSAASRDPDPSESRGSFTPTASLDLNALEALVSRRAPTIEEAALDVDLARSEVRQSRLLPNPLLDASWGTIPIGETNPPDLEAPMANVPNYGVGLSYTFPIGKRGPRTERALALERAAKESLKAATREQAIELAKLLGVLATSTLRLEGVQGVVDSGKKAIALAEERLASSFGTPLDIDRLRIEVARSEQQVLSVESDRAEALAACAALVGMPCQSFASADDAKSFLTSFINAARAAAGPIEDRPDVRALDAARGAASAEIALAKAQAIPDPTVRVGYLHDRFVVSGNQRNSLSLSVSLPIPIFDHGQAQAAAAEAKRARLTAERGKLIEASLARLPALAERLAAQRARQEALSTSVMPRALAVLRDVEAAAGNRLLSLSDVIQARRTVAELLVEEADSFADAFGAALEIAAERPVAPAPAQSSSAPTTTSPSASPSATPSANTSPKKDTQTPSTEPLK